MKEPQLLKDIKAFVKGANRERLQGCQLVVPKKDMKAIAEYVFDDEDARATYVSIYGLRIRTEEDLVDEAWERERARVFGG